MWTSLSSLSPTIPVSLGYTDVGLDPEPFFRMPSPSQPQPHSTPAPAPSPTLPPVQPQSSLAPTTIASGTQTASTNGESSGNTALGGNGGSDQPTNSNPIITQSTDSASQSSQSLSMTPSSLDSSSSTAQQNIPPISSTIRNSETGIRQSGGHSPGAAGTIIGAVLGSIFGLAALILLLVLFLKRRRRVHRATSKPMLDTPKDDVDPQLVREPSLHDSRYQKNLGYYLFDHSRAVAAQSENAARHRRASRSSFSSHISSTISLTSGHHIVTDETSEASEYEV